MIFTEEVLNDLYGNNEMVYEGANIDMTKKFSEYKKQYKEKLSQAKKAYREKNYSECKKNINDAKKIVSSMKSDIKKVDTSGTDTKIWGFIAGTLINFGTYFIAALSGGIIGVASVYKKNALSGIKSNGKMLGKAGLIGAVFGAVAQDIIDIKDGDGKADSNIYRTKLIQACDNLNNTLDNWMKKAEKAANKVNK